MQRFSLGTPIDFAQQLEELDSIFQQPSNGGTALSRPGSSLPALGSGLNGFNALSRKRTFTETPIVTRKVTLEGGANYHPNGNLAGERFKLTIQERVEIRRSWTDTLSLLR